MEKSFKWRMTGFYGHLKTHRRYESWDLLTFLNNQLQLPWLCLGDFNEILSTTEKSGGAIWSQQQMDGFRNVVDYCAFQDLGYCGSDFTWCNMQEGDNKIYLRLDRAFANLEWTKKFWGMKVHHLVNSTSDHSPLLVSDLAIQNQTQAKRFHFETIWTKNAKCKAIIEKSWGMEFDLSILDGVMANLRSCAAELTNWSSKCSGKFQRRFRQKEMR